MKTSLIRVSDKVKEQLVYMQDKKKDKEHRQVTMTEIVGDLIEFRNAVG